MNSNVEKIEGVLDERQEYLESMGDGIIEGVWEGIKEGVSKGAKSGVRSGLKECFTPRPGDIGDSTIEDLASRISELDISMDIMNGARHVIERSLKGYLDTLRDRLLLMVQGQKLVLDAEGTGNVVELIKGRQRRIGQRLEEKLPRNPISSAVAGGLQVALDIGLDRGMQSFKTRLHDGLKSKADSPHKEPRKPTRDDIKQIEEIKATVRSSVSSAVEQVIHDITKRITQRVIAKLRNELEEKSFQKFKETVLEQLTEQQLEQGLDGGIRLLTEKITEDSVDTASFIADIDESFSDTLRSYFSSLTKRPSFPLGRTLMVAIVILAIAGITYALLPGNDSPVAEASIEWIEGHTVAFSSDGCYDPDGYIDWYYWEFGDGTASEDSNPEHTYEEEGEYTVTLTVCDNSNTRTEDQTYVTVDYSESLPDLVIPEVWVINHGQNENTVHYLIENQGDTAAEFSITLLKFGRSQCEDAIEYIEAGQSLERQFREECWLSEKEILEFELYVYADADDDIDESNENNNVMSYKHE